jgi:hypothetical protein
VWWIWCHQDGRRDFEKFGELEFKSGKEIGLGGKKGFESGGFQAMILKRVISLLLRLRYLGLLMEINVLMGLRAIWRDQDFRRAKP